MHQNSSNCLKLPRHVQTNLLLAVFSIDRNNFFENQNSFGPMTMLRTALKIFAKRYRRSKFLSCQNELKLKIQSLLTLLIPKILSLSILNHK